MPRVEQYLPIALSLLLPGVSLVTNNGSGRVLGWTAVGPLWLLFSVFLFGLWKLNEALTQRLAGWHKWPAVVLINTAVILCFMWLQTWELLALPEDDSLMPLWFRALRLTFVAIAFILVIESLRLLRERQRLRVENLSLQSENLRAQFDQLKQQVNPHFLFNSLSTLRMMIRSNDEQSEEYVLRLSNVYRQILAHREDDTVTLQEELNFLDSYLYLLKLRHEDALQVTQDIGPGPQRHQLPVFALQLLVENAIKHNVVSEAKPLHLRITQPGPHHIAVTNTYQPKAQKPEGFGMGLENLEKRYRLLGEDQGLAIAQTADAFTVTLALLHP